MNSKIEKTGASLARGKSRQDYTSPRALLDAIERRFGRIAWDLAATGENAVTDRSHYLGPGSPVATDSLVFDWRKLPGVLFCNPPFGNLEPWLAHAEECRDRSGWLVLLVPASVGSAWWSEHAHDKARCLFLSPRLTFGGCDQPYPKDCALLLYGFHVSGYEPWRWDR